MTDHESSAKRSLRLREDSGVELEVRAVREHADSI